MNNYETARLDEKNVKHLYPLFREVYGKRRPDGFFHRKYDTSYTGVGGLGYFALHNGKPVAYFGAVPTSISIKGMPVLAAQVCDVMTAASHRGKGLFHKLAQLTLDLAQKEGVHFVFGFPNQDSYAGFVDKLNFAHIETLNRYIWEFKDGVCRKLRRNLAFRHGTGSRTGENILLDEGHDGIMYTLNYLDYKAFGKNFWVPCGNYSVWINSSNGLWVGSVYPGPGQNLEETLRLLEKKFSPVSMTYLVSPGTRMDDMFSSLLKPEPAFPVIIKNISGHYSTDHLKFQFADVDIF